MLIDGPMDDPLSPRTQKSRGKDASSKPKKASVVSAPEKKEHVDRLGSERKDHADGKAENQNERNISKRKPSKEGQTSGPSAQGGDRGDIVDAPAATNSTETGDPISPRKQKNRDEFGGRMGKTTSMPA